MSLQHLHLASRPHPQIYFCLYLELLPYIVNVFVFAYAHLKLVKMRMTKKVMPTATMTSAIAMLDIHAASPHPTSSCVACMAIADVFFSSHKGGVHKEGPRCELVTRKKKEFLSSCCSWLERGGSTYYA